MILACFILTTSFGLEFRFSSVCFPVFDFYLALWFLISTCESIIKDLHMDSNIPVSDESLQDTLPDTNPADLQAALWQQVLTIGSRFSEGH